VARLLTDVNSAHRRLLSLDAVGGLAVAAMLLVNDSGHWHQVPPWLEYASWNGCTFADYIFPCFLFIAGVSLTLALLPLLPSRSSAARWSARFSDEACASCCSEGIVSTIGALITRAAGSACR
jgi:predicted acyltransferase